MYNFNFNFKSYNMIHFECNYTSCINQLKIFIFKPKIAFAKH